MEWGFGEAGGSTAGRCDGGGAAQAGAAFEGAAQAGAVAGALWSSALFGSALISGALIGRALIGGAGGRSGRRQGGASSQGQRGGRSSRTWGGTPVCTTGGVQRPGLPLHSGVPRSVRVHPPDSPGAARVAAWRRPAPRHGSGVSSFPVRHQRCPEPRAFRAHERPDPEAIRTQHRPGPRAAMALAPPHLACFPPMRHQGSAASCIQPRVGRSPVSRGQSPSAITPPRAGGCSGAAVAACGPSVRGAPVGPSPECPTAVRECPTAVRLLHHRPNAPRRSLKPS